MVQKHSGFKLIGNIDTDGKKIQNLPAPASNGDSIRATTKITESNVEDSIDKKHEHSNKTEIDKVTDGDHDVISSGNPHSVSKSDVGLGNVTDNAQVKKAASSTDDKLPKWKGISGDELEDSSVSESDAADAVTKKHSQNTDTGTSNNFDCAGELSVKLYSQNDEPTLGQDNRMAIWIDTDDSNRVYLLYRRGTGDQVAVELA